MIGRFSSPEFSQHTSQATLTEGKKGNFREDRLLVRVSINLYHTPVAPRVTSMESYYFTSCSSDSHIRAWNGMDVIRTSKAARSSFQEEDMYVLALLAGRICYGYLDLHIPTHLKVEPFEGSMGSSPPGYLYAAHSGILTILSASNPYLGTFTNQRSLLK